MAIRLDNITGTRKYAIPFYLALIVAGLAGNYCKFSILNADFIFGSIFAMLALQFFGYGPGVLAAAAIAGYTYLAWNHPYALITMTAEVTVVGWLISRRKMNLLMADTLYWLFIGIPLGFFCFHVIAHFPISNALFLMTKQAVNGIANALVARLIFAGCTFRSDAARISLREIVTNLLAFFVLFPALILLAVGSRADLAETDRQIRAALIQDSRRMTDSLENWYVTGALNFDRIRTILKINSEGQNTLYTLLDKNNNVIITNRQDQEVLTPFSRGEGSFELSHLFPTKPLTLFQRHKETLSFSEKGITQWTPTLPPNTSSIDLWGKSFYVAESTIGNLTEWKLILEQPAAPFQKKLYNNYTGKLLLLFAVLLVSLALAEFLSRRMVATTEELRLLTNDLPDKLASGQQMVWPESVFLETHHLIDNFRAMAASLTAKFMENRQMNELLEQRVAERTRELQTSEEHLANALEIAHLGHWEYEVATDLFTFNDHFYKIFRTTAEQVGGYTMSSSEYCRHFVHPEEITIVGEETRKAIESADPHFNRQLEHRMLYADGTTGHIAVRFFIVKDASGRTVKTYGVNQDITERKRAEEAQAQLAGQLQQAQKIESVGRLAGGVAHDFNNMLGVILGHVEIAIDKVDTGQPLLADLQEIQKAANRSAALTRQMLAFARKQTIAPKVLDLNETLEGMLKMLRRLIGEDIHLAWLPGINLWPVKVDPSQIDQILANLCINARDAIAGVGKVTIETGNISFDKPYCNDHAGFVPGDYVLLAVSDDGCGMDKEILEKLFEPFFTTKGLGQGTGLGLATVYGIVKQNSGFINVYSEPDQGTTFSIYLPRHSGQVPAQTEGPQESVRRGRETLLVVEDEPALLDLNKVMLEKQGYRVLVAGGPGEALRLAEEYEGEIHLLITDVVMPEMNGRDLAKKMLPLYPDMKRLFMSGYTANVIAHHGVLDEGVHFLQKPFSRKDLAAKVREALDCEYTEAIA